MLLPSGRDYMNSLDSISTQNNFSVKIVISFILILYLSLIALGITGSSIHLLYKSFLSEVEIKKIAFSPKPIRSDEWAVFTPMAIGQYNHNPAFPIINQNVGMEGENMLIFGMTGVPVKHISALAKPATWGFFLFDLKRALAWYWWFPIFGCFFSLWWLLSLLLPGRHDLGFLLSLLFCTSPYVVAWSYWPAYCIIFPTVAFGCIVSLLETKNRLLTYILGLLIGVSVAGFALTLYPPWQISLGFLFLCISIGFISRTKIYLNLNAHKILAIGLAGVVACTILGYWWHDAKIAIEVLANTVYPGQRALLTGGDQTILSMLRGYTNIASLSKVIRLHTNQSEVSSFYFLFLPLMFALYFKVNESPHSSRMIIAVTLFVYFCFYYMFHGITPLIAKLSLWGRVTTQRMDLALGLAYIILCGPVLAGEKTIIGRHKKILAHVIAAIWAIFIAKIILQFSPDILIKLNLEKYIFVIIMTYVSGLSLILGYKKSFLLTSILLCLVTTFRFHPLIYAPNNVNLISHIDLLKNNPPMKVLVFDESSKANALISSGISTINGTMYYPQEKFWKKFNIDIRSNTIVNRYQHLVFHPVKFSTSPNAIIVTTPWSDQVLVQIDPEHFNFNLLGITHLLTPNNYLNELNHNNTIIFVQTMGEWSWFKTVKPNPSL